MMFTNRPPLSPPVTADGLLSDLRVQPSAALRQADLRPTSAHPALELRLFDEIAVLVRKQVRLDLADRIDRDVDHDQQAGSAEEQRNPGLGDHVFGNDADPTSGRSRPPTVMRVRTYSR